MAGATTFGIPYPQLADLMKVTANMQALATKVDELLDFPFCKLILPSDFPVANASNTVSVPFPSGSEVFKTHGSMHSNTVTNTRVIAPKKGIYRITAVATFAPNTTGFRTASIGKNGVRQAPESGIYTNVGLPAGANATLPPVTAELTAQIGDYFELFVYQSSGGGLNLKGDGLTTTTGNTVFTVAYHRPIV